MAYADLPSPTLIGGKETFLVPGSGAGTLTIRLKAAGGLPAGLTASTLMDAIQWYFRPDGDSISTNYLATGNPDYGHVIQGDVSSAQFGDFTTIAVPNQRSDQMLARLQLGSAAGGGGSFSPSTLPTLSTGQRGIVAVLIGVNDATQYSYGTTPSATLAALQQNVTDYVALAGTKGWDVILISLPAVQNPSHTTTENNAVETYRTSHNAWLFSNWLAIGAKGYVRFGKDYRFNALARTQDSLYYIDGVHPTGVTGRGILASLVKSAVIQRRQGLLPVVQGMINPNEVQISTDVTGYTAINDDSGSITYGPGAWTVSGASRSSNNAAATITYTGTFSRLKYKAQRSLTGAPFTVTIDGVAAAPGTCKTLDGETSVASDIIWDSGHLKNGSHTVVFTITPTGTDAMSIDALYTTTTEAAMPSGPVPYGLYVPYGSTFIDYRGGSGFGPSGDSNPAVVTDKFGGKRTWRFNGSSTGVTLTGSTLTDTNKMTCLLICQGDVTTPTANQMAFEYGANAGSAAKTFLFSAETTGLWNMGGASPGGYLLASMPLRDYSIPHMAVQRIDTTQSTAITQMTGTLDGLTATSPTYNNMMSGNFASGEGHIGFRQGGTLRMTGNVRAVIWFKDILTDAQCLAWRDYVASLA